MRRFRRFWLVFVVLVTALFGVYRLREHMTADASTPVFSCEEEMLQISVRDGEEMLLQGVTASDAKDGDLTSDILVEKLSNFYGDGRRVVTYVVFDSDGNCTRMEREITYRDYHRPRFELSRSLRFATGEQIDLYKYITASDCLDGDLSAKLTVQMDSNINNRAAGTYKIEYSVTNSAGDTVYLPVDLEVYQYRVGMAQLELSDYLLYYDGTTPDYAAMLELVTIGTTELEVVDDRTPVEDVDPEEDDTRDDAEDDVTDDDMEDVAEEDESMVAYLSNVTVQSMVNPWASGVYPVYLMYDDGTYEGMQVILVVVEE